MTDKEYTYGKEKARRIAKKIVKIIGFTILGFGLAVLFGFVIMWLWNWLMPMIFNLTTITYWQAVGLFILAKILFGGIGGGGGSDDSSHSHDCNDKHDKKGIRGEFEFEGVGKSIRKEFSREFNKEFDKEFDKEFEKEYRKHAEVNEDYDELYESWWQEKGEKSFYDYMNKKDENKE